MHGMKTNIILAVACSVLCLPYCPVFAGNALDIGARYHTRHSQYTELPYNNGDWSYQLGYEYHEGPAFWQLLVDYAPSISKGTDGRGLGVDGVITPQINLLFEDRNWLAGVGALSSYIMYDDKIIDKSLKKDDWTDIYWQVMIGYDLPLPAFDIEVMVYYPFEKWKTFKDFKTDDLEFGIMLKRMF